MRLGIDLMGGDSPPELLFPAVVHAAAKLPSDYSLVVFAAPQIVSQLSSQESALPFIASKQIAFHPCDEVITMSDAPLAAVRGKKQASLVVGMHLLKNQEIDALISCGNTGALIASAALTLPLFPGISHPALLATLPTKQGSVAVLDVGGSVSVQAEHLVRFSFLGAAYQKAMQGIERPRVGLLNIGIESGKGNMEVREAYDLLKHYYSGEDSPNRRHKWHFIGNIESRDLFQGSVDVLVTDGFTGNVLLKTAEGTASFIFDALQEKLHAHASASLLDVFSQVKTQFNYAEYPGAIVCGVEGVVIKAHGNSTASALFASILKARDCLENQAVIHMSKMNEP